MSGFWIPTELLKRKTSSKQSIFDGFEQQLKIDFSIVEIWKSEKTLKRELNFALKKIDNLKTKYLLMGWTTATYLKSIII